MQHATDTCSPKGTYLNLFQAFRQWRGRKGKLQIKLACEQVGKTRTSIPSSGVLYPPGVDPEEGLRGLRSPFEQQIAVVI